MVNLIDNGDSILQNEQNLNDRTWNIQKYNIIGVTISFKN